MAATLSARVVQLERERAAFVQATVVRVERPSSAHAGDAALVHPDGAIEGFVGGTCAEASVRVHALATLTSGRPLLLRIRAGAARTDVGEGVVTVDNPCLSGGGLEVFLEPHRPAARLLVVGETPVARALVALAGPFGLDVEVLAAEGDDLDEQGGPGDRGAAALARAAAGAVAVVVASHGRGEEPALEAALAAGAPYVGLVASRTRGAAVLASLAAAGADRVHSPAGLDIGGRTAPQVALSILAEVLASGVLAGGAPAVPDAAAPPAVTATDPVCGMAVVPGPGTPRAVVDGVEHHFCGPGCAAAFTGAPREHAAR